jgi:hypothetical protein
MDAAKLKFDLEMYLLDPISYKAHRVHLKEIKKTSPKPSAPPSPIK